MNTSNKAAIRELAQTVNEGLSAYIAVHNRIIDEAATTKSIFKNFGACGVPMSELLADAEKLLPVWEKIAHRVESFRAAQHNSSVPKDELDYLDLLRRYVAAVQATVSALVERQRLYAEVAKGGATNPVNWDACKQQDAAYHHAVREYSAIGKDLNAAGHDMLGIMHVPDDLRSNSPAPSSSLLWLHLPLVLLGIYNSYKFVAYYGEVWSSLHQQGMGHGYLIAATLLGSVWNLIGLGLCFFGNSMIRHCDPRPSAQTVVRALFGAAVSFFVPGLMQGSFFIVITWFHSFLFE